MYGGGRKLLRGCARLSAGAHVDAVSTGLAIFVKTPGFSPVKTRLAVGVGKDAAEEFHCLSARAVGAVAQAAQPEFTPYWAVAELEALQSPLWKDLPTVWQGSGGLGARLHRIHEELLARHGSAFLCGADTPQLAVQALHAARATLEQSQLRFLLGPTHDGGFWLFGSRFQLPREVWLSITYSQSRTCQDLIEALSPYGASATLDHLRDVDQVEDLAPLRDALASLQTSLPEQRLLRRWLDGHLRAPCPR